MRIAIISDLETFPWAGCEELWAVTSKRVLELGHHVAFVQSRPSIASHKIEPLQQLGLSLIQSSLPSRMARSVRTRISWKLGSRMSAWFPAFTRVKAYAPDVMILNAGDALPSREFLRDLQRSGVLEIPYVLMCHNSHLFDKPVALDHQQQAARYYQRARSVLFVAERTRRETEHLLAASLPQASIVRNPVNMTDTAAIPMPSGSCVYVASIGRIAINSKGQDILLAALGSRYFKELDWFLSIYGAGPHVENLKVLAQHYGIAQKVAFKGHVHDIRAVWAENHILALPSRNESAPLVLVEAMLAGRPAVATNVGGITEWIDDTKTGFISEGIHIESFESALRRAWDARPNWADMGLHAREKALRMIDPDPGGTVLKLLQEILPDSGSPHSS